jgi:hypothetical protein
MNELNRNIRLGLNFSTSPLPPTPLLGIQFPASDGWSNTFYINAQPRDSYAAISLRPQVEFFSSSRFRFNAYGEGGVGYFFNGARGPDSEGGLQVLAGMGVEGCYRLTPLHSACLSAGYSAAWIQTVVYVSPSSSRPEGWDGRNLLSVGLTLALGL